MASYLGVEFREGFDMTFPKFKEMFSDVWVFKQFLPDEKEKHLRKAYKAATGKDAKDELPRSTNKSGKSKSIKRKQKPIPRDKKD